MDGYVCGSGHWPEGSTSSIVLEVEHVGQKWNGVDCGLSRPLVWKCSLERCRLSKRLEVGERLW